MEIKYKTCSKCGKILSADNFSKNLKTSDKLGSWCRACSNISAKLYNRKHRSEYSKIINNRWHSINQRCVNGLYSTSDSALHSPQFVSYHKKGITINLTREEFTDWMYSVEDIHNAIIESGDKSSIDRIDENRGYEIGNIQLLSLHANIEKRLGKKCDFVADDRKAAIKSKNARQYIRNKIDKI